MRSGSRREGARGRVATALALVLLILLLARFWALRALTRAFRSLPDC